MSSYTSISPDKLARLIGTAKTPVIIDVRTDEDFAADQRLIPGAVRRNHQQAADWGSQFSGRSAIVACLRGQKLAEGTAAWLRHANVSAETLLRRSWQRASPVGRRSQNADGTWSVIEPNAVACVFAPVCKNCCRSCTLQRPSPVLWSPARLDANHPSSAAPLRNARPLSSSAFSLKAGPRGVWHAPQCPGPCTR